MPKKSVFPPKKSLGYQVRSCHRKFDRLLSFKLSGYDLNSGFWYYLRALWIRDGLSQKELSENANVAANTTVTMLGLMIEKGLVKRIRDPDDLRKFRVFLTPRGRKLEAQLMPYALELNALASAGVTRQELDTCVSVLSRVSDNLENALEDPHIHGKRSALRHGRKRAESAKRS